MLCTLYTIITCFYVANKGHCYFCDICASHRKQTLMYIEVCVLFMIRESATLDTAFDETF